MVTAAPGSWLPGTRSSMTKRHFSQLTAAASVMRQSVALRRAAGDQRVGALRERVGDEKLWTYAFVAAGKRPSIRRRACSSGPAAAGATGGARPTDAATARWAWRRACSAGGKQEDPWRDEGGRGETAIIPDDARRCRHRRRRVRVAEAETQLGAPRPAAGSADAAAHRLDGARRATQAGRGLAGVPRGRGRRARTARRQLGRKAAAVVLHAPPRRARPPWYSPRCRVRRRRWRTHRVADQVDQRGAQQHQVGQQHAGHRAAAHVGDALRAAQAAPRRWPIRPRRQLHRHALRRHVADARQFRMALTIFTGHRIVRR